MSASKVDKYIGRRLRLARAQSTLSTAEVGKKVGKSYEQIYRYENGETSLAPDMMVKLAKLFDVKPEWFLEGFEP